MSDAPADPEVFEQACQHLENWLRRQLSENPAVLALEQDESGAERWFLRLQGEEKGVFSVWWTLGQRTLHVETYMLPAPEENRAEVFEFLLRRNAGIYGAAFAIGEEDAVYLVGRLPVEGLSDAELDRMLGTMWEWVERSFGPALHLGFESRFRR